MYFKRSFRRLTSIQRQGPWHKLTNALLCCALLSACQTSQNAQEQTRPGNQTSTPASVAPSKSAEIQLDFATQACKGATGLRSQAQNNLSQNWLNDSTLEIKASVNANCAVKILSGRYKLQGQQLTLYYTADVCGQPGKPSCVRCQCDHPVSYTLRGLPRADYQIALESDAQPSDKQGL